ncbi:TetR/AcrR family transcriptional regulator [Sphingobium estronivorans]|uniref:TetR/AcrR family transcriptional regulator n=1 Tax=Sphingobium estronivorans TaxID=1577690 RepID=UPI001238EE1D|nr:TetR/AcrR family transcriptional regulator [Sphingobium estronivorans]
MVKSASPPLPFEHDNRTKILNAASKVFLNEGLERTSVDRIAAAAHMSKQSIYELFPSKVALFEAAVRSKLQIAWHGTISIDEDAPMEDTLKKYALRLSDAFADPVGFGLFRANIAAARYFPELATELHEQRLAGAQPLADYLENLIQGGIILSCNPLAMAIRFGSLAVDGARYFLGAALPGMAKRERDAENAVRLFLNGYRAMTEGGGDGLPPAKIEPPVRESVVALRLSAEKFAALIEAVTNEFLDQGYRRANVDRAAAGVQVSKATVYRQFGNKEHLLRYIVQRDIYEASREPFEPLPAGMDAESALVAFARQVLDRHLAPANIAMHRLLVEEADLIPDLARLFYEGRVDRLGQPLRDLLAAQGLPPPNRPAVHAFYALATFAARFFTAPETPSEMQRDSYARASAVLFLHGLRKGTG